ncbi:hypothetical protein [Georgenia yuyongxinii]|uniref:Lipoprotein LpqN n=1 Tax=Georgenia yuyongxinii TaxID=2589797 RepID=A0A552WQI2_9MICO|nr:hypothetical protein [Georgenia yuyongxinii]TRW44974.1 hypothetical protein FJ693_11200 [Georgenia yuyongxinii]
MRSLRSLAVVPLIVLALAGCAGQDGEGTDDAAGATTSQEAGDMTPTDAPLGLVPSDAAGREVSPVDGLTLTVPDATSEEAPTTDKGMTTAVYRLPGGDAASGLPALQVQGGDPGRGLAEETYVQQQLLVGAGINSDIHRSAEEWPGAAEAVALTWSQSVEEDGGGTHTNDVLQLWLVDEQGRTYSVMAVAPEGELDGSAAEDAVLSATLG